MLNKNRICSVDEFRLRRRLEKEIFRWRELKERLKYLKFLEVFSNETKVEMRNKEREINAMLDGFIEERQIIHLEQTEHFVGHEESFFHGVDAYYHETLLFIEMKWSKVFNVRPRLSLFIFFTSETLAFILAGFFHKRMLRRLQNMQHKIKVI